jgi:hypothetical protein
MPKANPDNVQPAIVRMAVEKSKSLQAVYSQCVIASYHSTGRMDCGFTAADMVAWIRIYMPDVFDAKGKKVT